MKTNFFILMLIVLGGFSAKAQSVPMYIFELESHTKWEAVDKKWNDVRNQWVANCKIENSPQKSAQLLLQFESYVKWEAVEANWTSRRNAWVADCSQANSMGQVSKLLLEFESNLKWSAVDENWKTRRSGWVNELKGISQAANTETAKALQSKSTFKSVTIGNQTWMAENLNVDRFRNGDPIPQVKTEEEWEAAKRNQKPAWWFGTNSVEDYGTTYGKLYNWYAVNDPRGLAPAGWHIPDEFDWTELLAFLSKEKKPASCLKSKEGWIYDKNGSNEFGFSALPGGNTALYMCYNVGQLASWWSTTEELDDFAKIFTLNENDLFQIDATFKSSGNSIRCIKDK